MENIVESSPKDETLQVVEVQTPSPQIKTQDEVIQDIVKRVENNSQKVDKVVDELVNQYCYQLDELIAKFKDCLLDTKHPITEEELDNICLKLPTYLYFIGEAQERFGIKEDVAKSIKMELYNDVHRRTKGTIADKQAASEQATQEEDIVHKAYQRAYKRTKQKLEAAYELLNSIKKVIQRRMGEQELANVDSGRFRK